MSIAEVGDFLVQIKLSKYKGLFEEEEVDGDILIDLDRLALQSLGIENNWHQNKIIKKFRQFCESKL